MNEGTRLPPLNPLLKLNPSTTRFDGQPQWTLYHPVSNQFYKIGWAEYECLSRFHRYETAEELINAVNAETSLTIEGDDIQNLLQFLATNGLLDGKSQQNVADDDKSIWHKMLHGYLYFTIPLFKPENFLKKTSHIIKPFLSREFHLVMVLLLVIGVVITVPRLDEFLSSFTQIFTLEGVILSFVILTAIKIIHEFAHGYVATINGVSVPHMGVAFIVLYPVLYTEATGAWRLTDKRSRMAIGLAGVRFEIYLAAVAMIMWHFVTPGLAQMICFTVAMISLGGSLLVNLNPLMRFDGYYVLSDYLNIENLHTVALDYARHSLRSIFLGLHDDRPYDYSDEMAKYLTAFGYAVMVYRFFLFLGIAVLVYAVFLKPLGLIAMILELTWFIGLPIYKEFKIWWERRMDFIKNFRFFISFSVFVLMFVWLSLPIQATQNYPAVMHVEDYQLAYAPLSARVEKILVENSQEVRKGDTLIILKSDKLDKDVEQAQSQLNSLEVLKRRDQTNVDLYRERRAGIQIDIETAKKALENLKNSQDDLTIKAKFDGIVYDIHETIRQGQAVMVNDPLLRVTRPSKIIVSAYVPEKDHTDIHVGSKGVFRPQYDLTGGVDILVSSVKKTAVQELEFEGLSSIYGGEIPSQETQQGGIEPLNTQHKIIMDVESEVGINTIEYGHVTLTSKSRSILFDSLPRLFSKARQELSFN